MQLCTRGGTHARRIAQPHVFSDRCQIEIELPVVVSDIALQVEVPASAARRKLLDMNSVLRERERAIHFAQPAGQARVTGRSIPNLNVPLRQWIAERAAYAHANRHQARGRKIRIDAANQLQIGLPVGGQIQFLRSGKVNPTVPSHVGSFTDHVRGFQFELLLRIREAHRTLVMQFYVLHIDAQVR